MGNSLSLSLPLPFFSSPYEKVFSSFPQNTKLMLLGLDGAGKTTLLNTLSPGKVTIDHPLPQERYRWFFTESIALPNSRLHAQIRSFDVGGGRATYELELSLCRDMAALIFLIDLSDRDRLIEGREEMHRFLERGDWGNSKGRVSVLVLANRGDADGAYLIEEAEKEMSLKSLNCPWRLQPVDVKTGKGVVEVMEWLAGVVGRRAEMREKE